MDGTSGQTSDNSASINNQPCPNDDESISLLQIELDGGDPSGFIGCQVQVRGLNYQVKFQGELIGYDKVNGNVTMQIIDDNNKAGYPSISQKIASVRETFVIG